MKKIKSQREKKNEERKKKKKLDAMAFDENDGRIVIHLDLDCFCTFADVKRKTMATA